MRRRINRRATMASKANLPPRSLSCSVPPPPAPPRTNPGATPLFPLHPTHNSTFTDSGFAQLLWQLGRVLGMAVESFGGEERTESGFVWSPTAWRVASLHAPHLVSVDSHCVEGRFAPCDPCTPQGYPQTPIPNFLSRLSYEEGVNKRSLPLYALTNS